MGQGVAKRVWRSGLEWQNGTSSHARPLAAEEGRRAQGGLCGLRLKGDAPLLWTPGRRSPEWKLDGAKVCSTPREPCRAGGGQVSGEAEAGCFHEVVTGKTELAFSVRIIPHGSI